jgi:hypothetical protein
MKSLMPFLFPVFVALGVTSCGGAIQAASVPLTIPQLVSHEGYSTVALVWDDIDNDQDDVSDIRVSCSAVWVDATHILTAYHCVVGERQRQQARQDEKEKNRPACEELAILLGICDPDEEVKHKVIETKGLSMHFIQWKEVDDVGKEPTAQHLAHVVSWDESHDLALLEAAGHAIPSHEVARVAVAVPGYGERIHVCGHLRGLYWSFLEGSMAGYRGDMPVLHKGKTIGPVMQLQVPIYYGNSGGGAFNEAGELIGIADFLMNIPAEGFFIPVDPIRAFLIDQEILPGKVKEVKKEEAVKPAVPPIVNITVVAPPPPPEKADIIPSPPLPIPLPPKVHGSLGHVPTP